MKAAQEYLPLKNSWNRSGEHVEQSLHTDRHEYRRSFAHHRPFNLHDVAGYALKNSFTPTSAPVITLNHSLARLSI